MKRPLSEIVAEWERIISHARAQYGERADAVFYEVYLADLERLCQAVRCAEKMRSHEFADNSGEEYDPRCPHCGIRELNYKIRDANGWATKNDHEPDCPIRTWDAIVGGSHE